MTDIAANFHRNTFEQRMLDEVNKCREEFALVIPGESEITLPEDATIKAGLIIHQPVAINVWPKVVYAESEQHDDLSEEFTTLLNTELPTRGIFTVRKPKKHLPSDVIEASRDLFRHQRNVLGGYVLLESDQTGVLLMEKFISKLLLLRAGIGLTVSGKRPKATAEERAFSAIERAVPKRRQLQKIIRPQNPDL
ncbi:MAG: hypothetical protein QFB86_00665 [Patescibacteria group bacterium]|nr:hypothetical protein [Patescibacteria group bacterium]